MESSQHPGITPEELEAQAEAGHAEPQFLLGCLHAQRWQQAAARPCEQGGRKGKKDATHVLHSKAMAWFERAARQGHQNAMYALAQIGLEPHVAAEVQERAVQWLSQAGELGMPSAQGLLGELYGKGYVSADGKFWISRDFKECAKWFRLAAEQGVVTAQFGLCCLYTEGWGVEVDHHAARRWLQEAARNGHRHAATLLQQSGGA